ncbi:hypothetical protein E4N82_09080 [Treponema denticola]|uniref:hypothetical protein n=1 Tax=Treponema denticola TaxID=158 RepID=UPI0040381936
MKLIFTWEYADPGAATVGVRASYYTYEADIPDCYIPDVVLQEVKRGTKPQVRLVNEDIRN